MIAAQKAPAPAATGARANNQALGGNRFTPMYANPFSGAIEPTNLAAACAYELSRRLNNVTRIARGAA